MQGVVDDCFLNFFVIALRMSCTTACINLTVQYKYVQRLVHAVGFHKLLISASKLGQFTTKDLFVQAWRGDYSSMVTTVENRYRELLARGSLITVNSAQRNA